MQMPAVEVRKYALPVGIVVADSRAGARRSLSERIAGQADLRVAGAFGTSQDTWLCLRRSQPDLLLLDSELPDSGGWTLLRRIGPDPDLCVILLTEERKADALAEAMILGARGAISRTARPEMLLRAVRSVLAGELWFPRAVTRALRDRILAGETAPRAHPAPGPGLTRREAEVLERVILARTDRQIAQELGISQRTVRQHLRSIFDKLDVSNRMELALLGVRDRL